MPEGPCPLNAPQSTRVQVHAYPYLLLTLGITNQFSMLKEKNLKQSPDSRFLLVPGNFVEEKVTLLRKTLSPGTVVESMA